MQSARFLFFVSGSEDDCLFGAVVLFLFETGNFKEVQPMGPVVYALFAYALTAVISFAVTGIIVLTDRLMSGKEEKKL